MPKEIPMEERIWLEIDKAAQEIASEIWPKGEGGTGVQPVEEGVSGREPQLPKVWSNGQ
jgi:hypothetical protein